MAWLLLESVPTDSCLLGTRGYASLARRQILTTVSGRTQVERENLQLRRSVGRNGRSLFKICFSRWRHRAARTLGCQGLAHHGDGLRARRDTRKPITFALGTFIRARYWQQRNRPLRENRWRFSWDSRTAGHRRRELFLHGWGGSRQEGGGVGCEILAEFAH